MGIRFELHKVAAFVAWMLMGISLKTLLSE